MFKKIIRSVLRKAGYDIRRAYVHTPWECDEFTSYYAIAAPRTLVSRDSCYVLERLFRQTQPVAGDIFECGVYKGGTAALFRSLIEETKCAKKLYLFDSFEGMPDTDPSKDWHNKGDFSDTSIEEVRKFVGGSEICIFRKGFIPDTFAGLSEIKISFAHIDVDIYRSVTDCLKFVWPRISVGGAAVIDDYGLPTCPGARQAVDDFFQDGPAVPLCLHSGQAVIFKGPN